MSFLSKIFYLSLILGSLSLQATSPNQTSTVSPIRPGSRLPFKIRIEQAKKKNGNPFLLPSGLHSYAFGSYEGKWLFIAGRTNGMHGFNDDPNNFPPDAQNTSIFVVDPDSKRTYSRSLLHSKAGLTQDQIESLSVTSPQFNQVEDTLYMTGGYGYRTSIDNYTTFPVLTGIDLPKLIDWVIQGKKGDLAAHHIRQIEDPVFQITGGRMWNLTKDDPTLLVFGQDFEGAYFYGPFTQVYSEQIRRFHIRDDGKNLAVEVLPPKPLEPNPTYRRRDLNVVPILFRDKHDRIKAGLSALSGVFTVESGIWTVPVNIGRKGKSSMDNPSSEFTFKQGMNNYASAFASLYSKRKDTTYTIIFGGLSYGYFENGVFTTDEEIPFINQVTTIKTKGGKKYSQYIMDSQFPVILSTESNPGNPLLFGASALFIPANGIEGLQFKKRIFRFDQMKKRESVLLGYIVGGIQSTLPNTNTMSDSAASPYIFEVFLEKK